MKTKLFASVLLAAGTVQVSIAQNTGVGTTAPLMPLHVAASDSSVMLVENTLPLGPGRSTALFFKTGSIGLPYTGAIKTVGEGTGAARLAFYTFAASTPAGLKERMSITDAGNVGIGQPAAFGYKLDVDGRMRLRANGNTAGIWLNKTDNSDEAVFEGNYNDSIWGLYTNTGAAWRFFFDHKNARLGINNANPRVPISFSATTGKKISFYPGGTGDYGIGIYASELRMHTESAGNDITFGHENYAGTFTERMRIKGNGQVCIGSNDPASGYMLSVSGKLIAEEMRVQVKGLWPDYVFSNGYKLRPLEKVEAYIKQHSHLPNIPSAATVKQQGIAVGEMQNKLMEKVEELTLYLIKANKEIKALQEEVKALKNK
ncbi:MAG: hypothetical protein V4722_19225 [Bacteroidota bacterium]